MHKYLTYVAICFMAVSSGFLSSCRTVPLTGRSQFILTSLIEEKNMGLTAFKEYQNKYPRSTNANYNAVMKSCATSIIKATEYTEYDWEYTVFESKTQNAFCLPGGKIAVYTGLLDLMRNEAELSFVVAHEVAHALARHSGEQMSWESIQSIGAKAVEARGGNGAVFEKASDLGVMLPFSRKHEYEADRMGMLLMAKAGYDPQAAIDFWSRFTAGSTSSFLDGWMSTHPADDDRIEAMRQVLPEAKAEYAKAASRKGTGMSL